MEFNLNPKRVSRTTYGITGTLTINEDFTKYEVGAPTFFFLFNNKKNISRKVYFCRNYNAFMKKSSKTKLTIFKIHTKNVII